MKPQCFLAKFFLFYVFFLFFLTEFYFISNVKAFLEGNPINVVNK